MEKQNLIEHELVEGYSSRDFEFANIVYDSFVEGEFGVVSFLAEEHPVHFLGLNACPAANNVGDFLLPD